MSKVRFTRPGRLFGHELTERSAFKTCFLSEEGYFYPAADYEALEAKLDALLIGLRVREIEDLKTKTPEHFAKLAECIADDSQEKAAKILYLQAKLARLVEAAEKVVSWDIGSSWHKQFDAINDLQAAIGAAKVKP